MLCKVIKPNVAQKKYVLAFFSGFGSDYSFWNNLIPYFRDYECVLLSENYFCESSEVDELSLRKIFAEKRIIGIGHSLGYMKLCLMQEKYNFFKMSKIVSVEGFSNYLSDNAIVRPSRKASLEVMKTCYSINPIGTLIWFQSICGAVPDMPEKVDQKLLMDDLNLLDTKIILPTIPHLVLSSVDDFVIPFSVIQDNFGQSAKIVYTQFASHLLGMRYPKHVYDEIVKFIG